MKHSIFLLIVFIVFSCSFVQENYNKTVESQITYKNVRFDIIYKGIKNIPGVTMSIIPFQDQSTAYYNIPVVLNLRNIDYTINVKIDNKYYNNITLKIDYTFDYNFLNEPVKKVILLGQDSEKNNIYLKIIAQD